MQIFVGNLSCQTTGRQLSGLFSAFGIVRSVKIIFDNYTGRSQGFAFVDMPQDSHAAHAIKVLNSSMLDSQFIVVNEVRLEGDNY
ncbi:RNA-binding protein [uncultured Chitinophaga sp.]|jgi:RNA-binding proteins (RRM domain)|uniref:RNA recognition motif domain-containing protein n=1 Tax=uncultured Chitinophaga sp. TaxID=339340 RepID=UPI002628CB60|nr:RNA-binding protein [uncultured Chitinophaga sp.]